MILRMILSVIIFLLTTFSSGNYCVEQPTYTFQSTSTMYVGSTTIPTSPRRTIIYDDEDEYDYGDEEEIIKPGYDPTEPGTPVGGAVSTILIFALVYVIVLYTKKHNTQ